MKSSPPLFAAGFSPHAPTDMNPLPVLTCYVSPPFPLPFLRLSSTASRPCKSLTFYYVGFCGIGPLFRLLRIMGMCVRKGRCLGFFLRWGFFLFFRDPFFSRSSGCHFSLPGFLCTPPSPSRVFSLCILVIDLLFKLLPVLGLLSYFLSVMTFFFSGRRLCHIHLSPFESLFLHLFGLFCSPARSPPSIGTPHQTQSLTLRFGYLPFVTKMLLLPLPPKNPFSPFSQSFHPEPPNPRSFRAPLLLVFDFAAFVSQVYRASWRPSFFSEFSFFF